MSEKVLREKLLRVARRKGKHTEEEWRALKAAFKFRCAQCGCMEGSRQPAAKKLTKRLQRGLAEWGIAPKQITVVLVRDHIQPISHGGSDSIENIQPLCVICNGVKGSKWPWPPPHQALMACNLFCNE